MISNTITVIITVIANMYSYSSSVHTKDLASCTFSYTVSTVEEVMEELKYT
jgi:hypothetical protein